MGGLYSLYLHVYEDYIFRKVSWVMQINNINLPNNVFSVADLSRLKVGQVIKVEIISLDPNKEGQISLGGKVISAKLEAEVKTGERFLAVVKEADENGVVLKRENLYNPKINNLSTEQVITLINRGYALDPEISDFIVKFLNNNVPSSLLALMGSMNPQLIDLVSLIWRYIPQWSKISGSNFDSLIKYINFLGLDHERSILESFKYKKNEQKPEKISLKLLLLSLISDSKGSLGEEDKAVLNKILDEITGQQLWIQTGNKKSAYCLMHFPLQHNEGIYDCKLAVESSRKGRKMDLEHSHLALQVETQNIGIVGADLVIYENSINICFLNDYIHDLNSIIQKLSEETAKGFELLGYKLQQVSLKTFEEYPQFASFIAGKIISGVDLKG